MWGKRAEVIVHERDPFNAESPLAALVASDITPLDVFYSRNHGPIPDVDPKAWRLQIDGLVTAPMEVTLADLRDRFDGHEVHATLQCAGNRRVGFNAVREIEDEDPWGAGATSTATWRGVRLADVLGHAGVSTADGLHVAFAAPDVSALASPEQRYGSSIPLRKALSDEVLLAWEMNGEPLPRIHGGPVRVVVPGYIGARSVKWVNEIRVQAGPSDNYFQATAYRVLPPDFDPDAAGHGDGISLTSVALNCDILVPDAGAEMPAGPLNVRGYAFAGDDRDVTRVDVSIDDGATWSQAELAPARSRWTWSLWSIAVDVQRPGPMTITARAWDSTGALQPESAAALWNPKGYVNNSWASVQVTVR